MGNFVCNSVVRRLLFHYTPSTWHSTCMFRSREKACGALGKSGGAFWSFGVARVPLGLLRNSMARNYLTRAPWHLWNVTWRRHRTCFPCPSPGACSNASSRATGTDAIEPRHCFRIMLANTNVRLGPAQLLKSLRICDDFKHSEDAARPPIWHICTRNLYQIQAKMISITVISLQFQPVNEAFHNHWI